MLMAMVMLLVMIIVAVVVVKVAATRVAGDGDDFTVSSSGMKSLMKKCVTRCLKSEEDFVTRSTLPKRPMVRISTKFRP